MDNGVKLKEKAERFFNFIDRLKGRKDVKSRVEVLANPSNLKTMSILTKGKAEFTADAYFLSKAYDIFEPLQDYADENLETCISIGGQGREQTIRFMGALSESKILSKLGINLKGEEKET